MERMKKIVLLVLCWFLLQVSLCAAPPAVSALWEGDAALMARVAAYYRCERELKEARSGERRVALRRTLALMRGELMRDHIDFTSFRGIRGQCEDIHGGWFFDGPWMFNTFYRPFIQKFDVVRTFRWLVGHPEQASDVLPGGGVPDSAFFINRKIEAITPDKLIISTRELEPQGEITVTGKKEEGKSEGFYGKDERGWSYIFIVDPPGMEEQVTGAEIVGSTLMRMVGYNVPSSVILTLRGTGDLGLDGRRSVATKLVEGYRGHWSYRWFRDRREMRATRVFSAWIHNTDCVDHNTGISVCAVEGVPLTRYYIFDLGGSLGSWNVRTKEPRDGWVNYVDLGEIFRWPLTRSLSLFGLYKRPYVSVGVPYSEAVGVFDANFSPDRYKANYPNMAWREMTPGDGLWAARLIARFSEEQIRTAVELARYTHGEDTDYIYRTLLERRRTILDHYNIEIDE
jgi:hypothetical protein